MSEVVHVHYRYGDKGKTLCGIPTPQTIHREHGMKAPYDSCSCGARLCKRCQTSLYARGLADQTFTVTLTWESLTPTQPNPEEEA